MAIHKFNLEYFENEGRVRVTNEPTADGYICGFDILFDRRINKLDLKRALTEIIIQKGKPKAARGTKFDLTPADVADDIATRASLVAELEGLRVDNMNLKVELDDLKKGKPANANN